MGNYVYVALGSTNFFSGGLAVIDVRNPTNCVRVGGYLLLQPRHALSCLPHRLGSFVSYGCRATIASVTSRFVRW